MGVENSESAGYWRMLDGLATPGQRQAMLDRALELQAEQHAGRCMTEREFLAALLVAGGVSPGEAARAVDAGMADEELPAELRAKLD